MRLLLDENVPRQLKRAFTETSDTLHEMFTVKEKGWSGKFNGELLKLMLAAKFDGLITADKNLQHQQNFEKYPISVIILHTYRITYEYIKPLIPRLKELLNTDLPKGPTIIKQ